MGGIWDQLSQEPRSTAGAGRSLGSHSVLVDMPFLSWVPSACLSHLEACLKSLIQGLHHWFSAGGDLPPPPFPGEHLQYVETFLVVTAGVVLLAGCC